MTIAGGFLGGILSMKYGVLRILYLGAFLTITPPHNPTDPSVLVDHTPHHPSGSYGFDHPTHHNPNNP